MNKFIFYFFLVLFILSFSVISAIPADALPVKDAGPQDYLYSASLFGVCGVPYCSSLSPDYYLKACGDTAYKYYCGEGNTCLDGKCAAKSNTCPPGWVGDFYCSSLSPDSRLRLYQNADCSTTSYKYSCGTNALCDAGSCIENSPVCENKKIETYCSGLSNALIERWQLSSCSTEARKFNCATNEKCDDGKCSVIVCDKKIIGNSCSSLSNARLELYQNLDCSTTSLKFACSDSEICQSGVCVAKGSQCSEQKLREYCSELTNARIEYWKLGDCDEESRKYSCSASEQCELDGSDAKCVDAPLKCFGFFCFLKQISFLSSFIFKYFIFFVLGVVGLYIYRPEIVKRFASNKFFWYAIIGIIVLGMTSVAFSNVADTFSSWFRWFKW